MQSKIFNFADLQTDPRAQAGGALVREMMADFTQLAAQNRLAAAFYYSWISPPGTNQVYPSSIFRCGAPTEAGKLTLEPD